MVGQGPSEASRATGRGAEGPGCLGQAGWGWGEHLHGPAAGRAQAETLAVQPPRGAHAGPGLTCLPKAFFVVQLRAVSSSEGPPTSQSTGVSVYSSLAT